VYPELLDGEAAWEALDAAFRDDPYPDITTILARHRPFIEAAIRAERDAWKVLHDAKSGPYNYGSQEQLRIIIDAKAFLGFTETTR
jgi:hypothetical protein